MRNDTERSRTAAEPGTRCHHPATVNVARSLSTVNPRRRRWAGGVEECPRLLGVGDCTGHCAHRYYEEESAKKNALRPPPALAEMPQPNPARADSPPPGKATDSPPFSASSPSASAASWSAYCWARRPRRGNPGRPAAAMTVSASRPDAKSAADCAPAPSAISIACRRTRS